MRFFRGTASERAASAKTGEAGDLVIESDTGRAFVADGETPVGDLQHLTRADEVPLLDEDQKVPEENIPDRLSPVNLTASYAAKPADPVDVAELFNVYYQDQAAEAGWTTSKRLIADALDWWNVESFEGVVLDGTTNITSELAAALEEIHSVNGTAWLPPGTAIVDTLVLPVPAQRVGFNIKGAGVGRTILKSSTGVPAIQVGDGGSLDAQYVSVRDLTLDGNGVGTVGIRLNHTRFFECANVDIKGFTTYGVEIVGGVANYFAKFNRVRFATTPINVYCDGGGAGIGGNSNYFTNCHFSGSSNVNYNGAGTPIAVVINGGDSNEFCGCEFIASGTAIYLHNSSVGNKVIGNQFDGTTIAVDCASAGVQNTQILFNTGTVNINDSGTNTMFFGSEASSGFSALLYNRAGIVIGGPKMPVNVVPLRVRAVSGLNTDSFRVEKSDGTVFFKVDQAGNIETGPNGAVTAHAGSTFDNANNNSFSLRVRTGTSGQTALKGLIIQRMNDGQTANLLDLQNAAGTTLAGIGGKGQPILPEFTTAGRPTAATAGARAIIFDSTLGLPIFSDGTSWKKFDGTAA